MKLPDYDALRRERRRAWGGAQGFPGRTWVPEKYLLVDLETGDVWSFSPDSHPEVVGRAAQSARARLNRAAYSRAVSALHDHWPADG